MKRGARLGGWPVPEIGFSAGATRSMIKDKYDRLQRSILLFARKYFLVGI
jgi:hypothetical protein